MNDSKALIERLREQAWTITHMEAADHIERLEADNARLREVMAKLIDNYAPVSEPGWIWPEARAALAKLGLEVREIEQ